MIHFKILENPSAECVHFISQDEWNALREKVQNSSLTLIEANAASISNDSDLFAVLAQALKFPDYFGNNWDALDECLGDLEWWPAKGYVLLLSNSGVLWKNATLTAGKLISSWLFASDEWRKENVPFHLIFCL